MHGRPTEPRPLLYILVYLYYGCNKRKSFILFSLSLVSMPSALFSYNWDQSWYGIRAKVTVCYSCRSPASLFLFFPSPFLSSFVSFCSVSSWSLMDHPTLVTLLKNRWLMILWALHHADNPSLTLVSQLLTGDNYASWSRPMTIALSAKSKIGFIDGSIAKPDEANSHLSSS